MKKAKQHPTWHDVTAAKSVGFNSALTLSLTVLKDKMDFDNDRICEFMGHFESLGQSIKDGYVNVADLNKVLRDEYQIDFRE